MDRALQPALPGGAWARHRTIRYVDSAKEAGSNLREARTDIPASHHCTRDQQASLLPHGQRLPRQEGREEARPAGNRRNPRPGNSDRPHPRALHARRAFGIVGRHDPGRDAALSGRSGMAVEDHSRFPSPDQTRIRPQPRSPAQSRKCNDDADARRASSSRSEDRGETDSGRKQHSTAIGISNPNCCCNCVVSELLTIR